VKESAYGESQFSCSFRALFADDEQTMLIYGTAVHGRGSACGPVIVPVFKTGGRRVTPSPVGSTPTRFRHFSTTYRHTNHLQIS